MSVRPDIRALCLALAACSLAPQAMAQTVEAAPLRQIDPWGVGWLGQADGALPVSLWNGASAEILSPLMAALRPEALSPATQAALRRIVLSSGRPPEAGAQAVEARLSLMERVGEMRRSVDLRSRFPETSWGMQGAALGGEFDLAAGRSETACAAVAERRADDVRWMPSRALCYALSGDFDAASLVVEQTPHENGSDHAWLISAIETMRQAGRTQPAGRYATPFETAVSVAAGLSAPPGAFSAMAGDLAVSILRHPRSTAEQKRAALRPALRAGLATSADVRSIVTAETATRTPNPTGETAPALVALQTALAAISDADRAPEQTAQAVMAALVSATTAEDGRIAALTLVGDLAALPKASAGAEQADAFARALLMAGDLKGAAEWRSHMDSLPEERQDPWAAARIDFMIALATNGAEDASTIIDRLLAAAPAKAGEPSGKTQTPAQKRDETRRIETTRVLFLSVGAGRALSPGGRSAIASQKSVGKGVPDATLARIQSAVEAGAHGEAALASLALLGEDPSGVSFAGLADILTLLRRSGLATDADRIALEALQPWKTF
jgi:hypothetical protein